MKNSAYSRTNFSALNKLFLTAWLWLNISRGFVFSPFAAGINPSHPGTTPFPFLRNTRKENTNGEKGAHKNRLTFYNISNLQAVLSAGRLFFARLPPKIVINNRFYQADNRSLPRINPPNPKFAEWTARCGLFPKKTHNRP